MLYQILIILWHSVFVIIPFVVSRFGVKVEAKKTIGKLTLRSKINIYGECILTAIILSILMLGRSGEEGADDSIKNTSDITEISAAFIVASISAIVASFYEINKHNNTIDNSKI